MPFRIPVVSIVAPASDYGKTRLITGIIGLLAEEGLRVCVMKHAPHNEDPDEAKDTLRYRESGAIASAMINSEGLATYYVPKSSLEDALELLAAQGADLILCEGFKDSSLPKLLIVETADDLRLLGLLANVRAAVLKGSLSSTDLSNAVPPAVALLDYDARQVAGFIKKSFLNPGDGPH